MTFDALVAIIALGAGGLIIVMLVIAFPRMDEGSRRGRQSRSAESSSQRQVTIRKSRPMPTLRGAPSQRATPEARTTRARKPPWRPAWHRITDASTTLLHELSGALLYLAHGEGDGQRRCCMSCPALSSTSAHGEGDGQGNRGLMRKRPSAGAPRSSRSRSLALI